MGFVKAISKGISDGYIDHDNYSTININIPSYINHDSEGDYICHNCYNRIGYGNNCKCKIDGKHVHYMMKCRHNQNVNQKDIQENIKEMDKLLEEYLEEHPEERFDYDKFLSGYNFKEQKYKGDIY